MRVDESFHTGMEHGKLRLRAPANFNERRHLINLLSALENGNEQVLEGRVRGKMFAAGRVQWINDREILRRTPPDVIDAVGDKFLLRTKTAYLVNAGGRDFGCLFTQL